MKTMSMSPSLTVLLLSLLSLPAAVGGTETTTKTPPAFLLQDPSDSNCLRGEDFGRCSIDTLWYVVGSPGKTLKGKGGWVTMRIQTSKSRARFGWI